MALRSVRLSSIRVMSEKSKVGRLHDGPWLVETSKACVSRWAPCSQDHGQGQEQFPGVLIGPGVLSEPRTAQKSAPLQCRHSGRTAMRPPRRRRASSRRCRSERSSTLEPRLHEAAERSAAAPLTFLLILSTREVIRSSSAVASVSALSVALARALSAALAMPRASRLSSARIRAANTISLISGAPGQLLAQFADLLVDIGGEFLDPLFLAFAAGELIGAIGDLNRDLRHCPLLLLLRLIGV